jgi:hypothetical protein
MALATLEDALAALAQMQDDFDAHDDDAYSDLVDAVVLDCPPAVAAEFKRVTRGW